MNLDTAQSALAAMLALHLSLALAAPAVIGTAVAKGSFRVDRSTVRGNATLFEGASIETGAAGSSLQLSSGAKISLGSESKGTVFGDHIVLEKGEGRLEEGPNFRFLARGPTIQPETGDSSARVALSGNTRVQVAALSGSFRVLNSRGLLVASMRPGPALEFEPQTGERQSRVSGCLQEIGGHFVLTDETTNVVVELTGPGLNKEAGNRVETAGSEDAKGAPVPQASQFIRVTSVKRTGKGCTSLALAAVAGKGGPGRGAIPAAAKSPPGRARAAAVVGSVAAGAAAGGLAAAGKLPGQGGAPPPLSR